jgi:hypothetical protein
VTVAPDDLVHLAYDDSLTIAGVAHVCRYLDHFYGRRGSPSGHRLRQVVATTASELAVRRWLEALGTPYDLLGDAPFTQPGHVRLLLGGRPLDVHTSLVSRRDHIRLLRQEPAWLLEGQAALPRAALASEHSSETDLHAFVVLAALETRTRRDLRSALASGQPCHLLALPPTRAWVCPPAGQTLGHVVLGNLGREAVDIELTGRCPSQQLWAEHIKLDPMQQAQVPVDLLRLLFLRSALPPAGPLEVRSSELERSWRISPGSWINLWIYGVEIILAGWATTGEFRRQAKPASDGSTRGFARSPVPGALALPFRYLRPMDHLTARLRQE